MENILLYKMGSETLPRVKYVDKMVVEPPHVHIRRKTEEFILYYVLSGEMHLNEGTRQYVLKPDDMLILDPTLEHYGTKATACTYFYIHFHHNKMMECSEKADRLENTLIDNRLTSLKTHECGTREDGSLDILLPKSAHISAASSVTNLISNLHKLRDSHYNRLEYFELKSSSIFLDIIITLSRELTSNYVYNDNSVLTARSTQKIHDLLTFFQSDYASEISGKSIEERYNCNFDYLNRTFKHATGTTIFAYLNELRISKAKQMLTNGTGKISEVAEKSGFRDVYYFTKVFKKHTGVTPGVYSRQSISSGYKSIP